MRETLDQFMAEQMRAHGIPGVSMAIIRKGEIVDTPYYGICDVAASLPVTPSTLFQAASISKCLVALAALRLVEQGRLSLDEDVNEKLLSWKIPENEFLKTERVTLRRILSHTAGFTIHGFAGYAVGAPIPTLLQILEGTSPANNSPIRVNAISGNQSRYSGGGYVVLQQLLIDVAGQPFPELMRSLVLDPLGMSASTFKQSLPIALQPNAATGHRATAQPIPGGAHTYPEMAAAGLWTTPTDLVRFALAIRSAYLGESPAILAQATAREMLSRQMGAYGLGPQVMLGPNRCLFFHSGRNAGFDCLFSAETKTGNGEVIMLNANADPKAFAAIRKTVVEAFS